MRPELQQAIADLVKIEKQRDEDAAIANARADQIWEISNIICSNISCRCNHNPDAGESGRCFEAAERILDHLATLRNDQILSIVKRKI